MGANDVVGLTAAKALHDANNEFIGAGKGEVVRTTWECPIRNSGTFWFRTFLGDFLLLLDHHPTINRQ